MGKIKSYTSASGMKTTHYDENGNKIGETWRSPAGQLTHYDANGNKTGSSFTKPDGSMTHYDNNWNKTGYSRVTNGGHQVRHYDNDWNKTGESNQNFWGAHVTENSGRPSAHHAASSPGCATMLFLAVIGCLLVGILL